jgi:hypothetical protein
MDSIGKKKAALLAIAAGALTLALAAPAQAEIADTLHAPASCTKKDAADGEIATDVERGFWFCDDGVPSAGGITPNLTGANAVTVPATYGTAPATFAGLPAKGPDAIGFPGADATGNIALDVDVSLPDTAPPAGGYPMIFMMHGCCSGNRTSWESETLDPSGEKWHYNNAWFASRGYVVVTYTARGFVNSQNRGSTGHTQLDSRSFEINDFQALACNLLADQGEFSDATGQTVDIDQTKIVTTGGSYGGGFSWLSVTDPKWTCNADTGASGEDMSLAATAPRYGWTDLAYTLVPNGFHSELPSDLPDFTGCDTGTKDLTGADCASPTPVGIPKLSIVTLLYLSGTLGADHTTFSPAITDAFVCLQSAYPLGTAPLACDSTLSTILPEFLRERSAYYQSDWFTAIAGGDPSQQVPIYNAGTLTDPLFPAYENRRMANRILDAFSGYPIKQYYGDYQHFVQNKAKEWADLCGIDRHVCQVADYPGAPGAEDLNADPTNLVAGEEGRGVTTRLNKFIDNFALPAGGHGAVPANVTPDVTASLQVCPDNATGGQAADEAGQRFTAPTFEALTTSTLTFDVTANQTTTSQVAANTHAVTADPPGNFVSNGGRCPVETQVAGDGVASYTSEALTGDATMIGSGRLTIDFAATGATDSLQLNARLYDVLPNDRAVMVDRGVRRVALAETTSQPGGTGQVVYELHGNGWRFPAGHRVRIEIAQDDETFVRRSTPVSATTISHVELEIPKVEMGNVTIGGDGDPKPPPPPPPSGGGSGSAAGGDSATTPTESCKKKKGKKKKGKKKKKKKCK